MSKYRKLVEIFCTISEKISKNRDFRHMGESLAILFENSAIRLDDVILVIK
jgi:hypothetical protein